MQGNFKAHALTGVLCETSQGKPQVAVELELHDDEHKGQKIGWYGQLSSDDSVKFTVKALRTAGWNGTDLSEISFDGREVILVVEEEPYEDETGVHTRTRVRYINPVGGVAVKAPMSEDKAKSFAAQMKGKILALDQAMGTKQPAAQPTTRIGSQPPAQSRNASPAAPAGGPAGDGMPF